MILLHIHNEITNKGGTEVYLADLQRLLPEYGYTTHWMCIQQKETAWQWCLQNEDYSHGTKKEITNAVTSWIKQQQVQLVCIHNLFDSELIDLLVSLVPVIKFSHSPVIVCPGRDKYWRYSGKPCTIPYGLHCFKHAYTQGCTNRHPKRLIKDWTFVKEEIHRAKTSYRKAVVMSGYNAERLLECGIPENQISLNPYFTPYKEIQNPPITKKQLLFIGRIIDGKGVKEMIAAVAPVLLQHPDFSLNIIGDGPLLPEVKLLAEQKGISNGIRFLGWQPRESIDKYLESCHHLIFPSTYPESFGIVGIEAMMFAKPVVGFDTGGVSTWLVNNENGFLIEPGNIEALTASVNSLISNETLYRSMSEKAREMALDRFLPEFHLAQLDNLFRETIQSSNIQNKTSVLS